MSGILFLFCWVVKINVAALFYFPFSLFVCVCVLSCLAILKVFGSYGLWVKFILGSTWLNVVFLVLLVMEEDIM